MRLVSLVLAVLLCSCGSNAPANGGGDDAVQPPGDSRSEDEGPQYACPPDHYELSVDGLFCHPCKTDGSGPQPVGEALDDGNDCTMDKCSVQSGVVHYNVPKACDDGDDSTVDDRCKSGHCVGTPTIACPKGNWFEKEPGQCYQCNGDGDGIEEGPYPIDDGNECTEDECDKGSGVENDPLDALCDDNDPATLADHCKDGVCVGLSEVTCTPEKWWKIGDGLCALCNATGDGVAQGPFVYEDDNVCTDDWCDEKDGVVHEPENGACDDGNPETIGDYCDGGECIPGNMVKCVAGKWFLKLGQCLLCNETGDGYVGEGLPVDDGNECTEDICDPDLGLLFKPDSGLCDDGDPGTTGDYCVDGKCQGFAATTCEPTLWFVLEGICFLCNIKGDGVEPLSAQVVDDGDPCTTDACGGQLPPKHTPVPEGTPCDDGNEFTEGDACTGGKCKGTVANKCPAGDWYLVDGLCYLCNGDGTGPSGEGLPIDDGNVCTDDECDAGSGVQHDNNSSPCDDGNPQTGADVCKKGSCIGKPKICVPNEWEYDGPYWCVK
ncbi:MAG: hypothetical protein FJ109_21955, partial [Deltaproteobacteria bacterium]|nr:hypothetical protein [Deltaproteobacteria bacterium]